MFSMQLSTSGTVVILVPLIISASGVCQVHQWIGVKLMRHGVRQLYSLLLLLAK